jgi:hypothetical protein
VSPPALELGLNFKLKVVGDRALTPSRARGLPIQFLRISEPVDVSRSKRQLREDC